MFHPESHQSVQSPLIVLSVLSEVESEDATNPNRAPRDSGSGGAQEENRSSGGKTSTKGHQAKQAKPRLRNSCSKSSWIEINRGNGKTGGQIEGGQVGVGKRYAMKASPHERR